MMTVMLIAGGLFLLRYQLKDWSNRRNNRGKWHQHYYVPTSFVTLADALTLDAYDRPNINCVCKCGESITRRKSYEREPNHEFALRVNGLEESHSVNR